MSIDPLVLEYLVENAKKTSWSWFQMGPQVKGRTDSFQTDRAQRPAGLRPGMPCSRKSYLWLPLASAAALRASPPVHENEGRGWATRIQNRLRASAIRPALGRELFAVTHSSRPAPAGGAMSHVV